MDTLGPMIALHVPPATAEDRADVERLAGACPAEAGVDQGYTGARAATTAQRHGIRLEVVKLPEAKKGFVLLP